MADSRDFKNERTTIREGWISVKDRLPDNSNPVWLFPSYEKGFYTKPYETVVDTSEDDEDQNESYDYNAIRGDSYLKEGWYVELEQAQASYDFMFFGRDNTTHWMPLPSPPTDKQDKP